MFIQEIKDALKATLEENEKLRTQNKRFRSLAIELWLAGEKSISKLGGEERSPDAIKQIQRFRLICRQIQMEMQEVTPDPRIERAAKALDQSGMLPVGLVNGPVYERPRPQPKPLAEYNGPIFKPGEVVFWMPNKNRSRSFGVGFLQKPIPVRIISFDARSGSWRVAYVNDTDAKMLGRKSHRTNLAADVLKRKSEITDELQTLTKGASNEPMAT